MSIGIWRRLKRDRDIGRKAVLSDVKTAFTFTPALSSIYLSQDFDMAKGEFDMLYLCAKGGGGGDGGL